MTRLPVPEAFSTWWDEEIPDEELELKLEWRCGAWLRVGWLRPTLGALRFDPHPADFTSGAERAGRAVAKALTRAGWLRPQVDPVALLRLYHVRRRNLRVEFILDTNAMVEGVGHWLVDLFADRCDLVVTAVTLRELQDQHQRSGFGQGLPAARQEGDRDKGRSKKADRSGTLGSRQLYLAANRFRERPGYDRVLWRELELDDAALLLSRGDDRSGSKRSEADTLLLRAVRREIHDRVNGLERFFVTGDTALARRATTELPRGSLVAARVRELEAGAVLLPCAWWPGPDEGCRVPRHPARIVWELLSLGDRVLLEAPDGRTWRFQAFETSMWPSDYLEPWVDVEEERRASEGEARPESPTVWRPPPVGGPQLDRNLRVPARRLLDVLAALVSGGGRDTPLPATLAGRASRRHIKLLLESLHLAEVDLEAWRARPSARHGELVEAWRRGDRDAVFDLLRGWLPLEEWATEQAPLARPQQTCQAARSLASMLGQGMHVHRRWHPGGRRPGVEEMRSAVSEHLRLRGRHAIPVYTLLVDVFLIRLGVAPVRVVEAWEHLWQAGVFEGFEPREGGSSSGRHHQEVARLEATGWSVDRIDLEAVRGIRDLRYRGQA